MVAQPKGACFCVHERRAIWNTVRACLLESIFDDGVKIVVGSVLRGWLQRSVCACTFTKMDFDISTAGRGHMSLATYAYWATNLNVPHHLPHGTVARQKRPRQPRKSTRRVCCGHRYCNDRKCAAK